VPFSLSKAGKLYSSDNGFPLAWALDLVRPPRKPARVPLQILTVTSRR